MNIGIFGGSFDPIHIGHIIMAQISLEKAHLDKIYFVPTGYSYHKGGTIANKHDRFKMVELALKTYPKFIPSKIDIERDGPTYTVETLKNIKTYHSLSEKDELFFIMGVDSFLNIETWKNYKEIFNLAKLIVYSRPCITIEQIPKKLFNLGKIIFIDSPLIGISSTMIRERIKEGKDCSMFIPIKVYEYIQNEQLYIQ